MKRTWLAFLMAGLIVYSTSVSSGGWGRVFALEVRGDALAEPLLITDPAIVQELSFWVGPGTNFSEFMGPQTPERSIIDWERGEVTDRPDGLASYEVRFLLEPRDNPPEYLVIYEPDPENGSGYINTPASSGRIVTHDNAGIWMFASTRWNERVGTAISEQLLAQR